MMMKMLDEKDLQQVTAIADEARRGAVHDMQVIFENTIVPQLKLLAEGQQTILETLTPKSKTEELEEEVDFLKAVVRTHARQLEEQDKILAELKKKLA